jgi:hypothetical protein
MYLPRYFFFSASPFKTHSHTHSYLSSRICQDSFESPEKGEIWAIPSSGGIWLVEMKAGLVNLP